jgi:probable addiction module antidote protein
MATRNVRHTHSELLRDPQIASEYLSEAISSADPSELLMALRNLAEAHPDGISGLAERADMSRTSLYKMLSENGNPKLDSFMKVLHALHLKFSIEPEKKELKRDVA